MGARPRKGAERGPGAAVMPSRGRAPTLGSMRTKVKGEQDSQAVLSLTATIFLVRPRYLGLSHTLSGSALFGAAAPRIPRPLDQT